MLTGGGKPPLDTTSHLLRADDALETGLVGINERVLAAVAPFGGVKESGHGREGSRYGLDNDMHTSYLCLAGLA